MYMTDKHQATDTHVSTVPEKAAADSCSNLTIVLDIDEVLAVPDRIRDGEEGEKIVQYAKEFDIQVVALLEVTRFARKLKDRIFVFISNSNILHQ